MYNINLTLYLFSSGVKGEDPLIFDERGYNITFPCEEDLVCFHIWHLSTSEISDHIAVVTNGKIQTAKSEDQNSKCTLQIEDHTYKDFVHHRCQRRTEVFSPHDGEYRRDQSRMAVWDDKELISPDHDNTTFFFLFSPFSHPRVKPHAWQNSVTAVYSPRLCKAGKLQCTATTGQPDVGGWSRCWDTRRLAPSDNTGVFLWCNSDCHFSKSWKQEV